MGERVDEMVVVRDVVGGTLEQAYILPDPVLVWGVPSVASQFSIAAGCPVRRPRGVQRQEKLVVARHLTPRGVERHGGEALDTRRGLVCQLSQAFFRSKQLT